MLFKSRRAAPQRFRKTEESTLVYIGSPPKLIFNRLYINNIKKCKYSIENCIEYIVVAILVRLTCQRWHDAMIIKFNTTTTVIQ